MTIEEFLLARLDEEEQGWGFANSPYTGPMIPAKQVRDIVEWHKNWPILIETSPKTEIKTPFDSDTMTAYSVSVSAQMAWFTQQEYVKRFGTEPPAAPLLRKMASYYSDHEDFNPDWEI